MDLVSAAKNFEKKIMKIEPEELESFEEFTSLFYECFKPCIEGNEGGTDFIKFLYEELKSFNEKAIDEKVKEAYCKLFDKKVLQQKILEINSEFIQYFGGEVRHKINTKLSRKIETMNLDQNNGKNIQMIIDFFGDLARRFNNQNEDIATTYYFEISSALHAWLDSCKTKIDKVVKSSIRDCFYVFNDEDEDEKLEYKETVKKLKELKEKIIKCKYLLDDGGKKIVRSENYKKFEKAILEIAKNQSK